MNTTLGHIRNALTAAVIAGGITLTGSAQAVPVVDSAAVAQMIQQNALQVRQWAEESQLVQFGHSLQADLASFEVDNLNNAMANSIVRQNQNRTDIANTQARARRQPADDACQTVSASVNVEQAICGVDFVQEEEGAEYREMHTGGIDEESGRLTMFAETAGEFEARRNEALQRQVESCQEVGVEKCIDTGLMFGGDTGIVISDEDGAAEATRNQISLIAGPEPERATDSRVPEGTYAGNASRLRDMRREAIRQMVAKSLSEIRATRLSVDGMPSEFQNLYDFALTRWGSERASEWLATVTSTHPDKGDAEGLDQDSPEEVLRKMAQMQAFMTYLSVEQYRHSLRTEGLTAALVALELEPVD